MRRPVFGATLLSLAMLVAACGSASPSASPPPAASSATGRGFMGTVTAAESAVEAAGYRCVVGGTGAGFRHIACTNAGVIEIDVYGRADGSMAGVEAMTTRGEPISSDQTIAALAPALDAAAPSDSMAIWAAIRAAGSPSSTKTTILPGSGLSVIVGGYVNAPGLATATVLAPDIAAIWGRPPAPSPSASA